MRTNIGENNVYRTAKTREMKTRALNCAECIEDIDQRVLVKEGKIKKRLKCYFYKLFKGRDTSDLSELNKPIEDKNRRFV